MELVELELQLGNSCNVSLLDIRDPGTTAYHTDLPHESLPSLLDPEIDTPRNPVSFQPRYSITRESITDTPLSVQGNICYQSTPHVIYAVDNTDHCYQPNTHIVTPEPPTVLTTSSTPHAHPPQRDSVGLHQVHPRRPVHS